MESVYVNAGSWKTSAVARVILDKAGWSETESDAFQRAKSALEHRMTLAYRDSNCHLRVFIDASDFLWSGIVTQISVVDLSRPHVDQRHQPICFL